MSEQEKQILSRKLMVEALRKFKGLFNKSPDDQALELYADMLSAQFEFKQVTWALTEIVKSGSPFFPSCGEIFAKLEPAAEAIQDKAPQIANEMLNALRTYGPHAEDEMLKNVSDDARAVFIQLGYTGDIRNSENFETTKAQLERLARGVLASREANNKNETLQKIGIDTGKVLTLKKPGMQSLSFGDYSPEGA